MEAAHKKYNNRLWQARRRAGLEQKQVARLLGHKTCDQISRYERGARMPSFQTALKLELIYRTRLSELFPEHYAAYRGEIAVKLSQIQTALPAFADSYEADAHVCTYAAMLEKSKLSENDINRARRHAIGFHETLSDAINRRNSPND